MAQEVSILVMAEDHFSETIRKMQTVQNSFAKDVDGLNQKLNVLKNNRTKLKVDVNDAREALNNAKRAYEELGDAAARSAYEAAQANYDQAVDNLKIVSNEANRTQKAIEQLTVTERKYNNRAGAPGQRGTLAALSKAGLGNMLGQSLGNIAGVGLSSMFGGTYGSAIGSVLSSTIQGAAMGSIAGHAGKAIGAAVGAATGVVNAATQIFTEKDAAFKSAVQEQYGSVTSEQAASLVNGSAIAADREQFRIALGTLAGDQAEQLFADIKDFATASPFSFDDLKGMSRTLLAGGYDPDEIVDKMRIIGDAGATLGLGTDDMSNIATYLSRMQITGKATTEYLNPLLERGIPVFDYLAESLGKSNAEVQEMLRKGLIPGAEAADAITRGMEKAFGGGMDQQMGTFSGLASQVEDMQNNLDAAMGEGYNKERIGGMQATIDFMSGETGTAMQEAYEKIGAFQADLENQKEEIERKHLQDVMATTEYQQADAATQGMMLMQAKANAASEYATTEGYQTQLAAEKALIQGIQEGMSDEYFEAGLSLGKQFDKGLIAARSAAWAAPDYADDIVGRYAANYGASVQGNAWGIDYVPRDNFVTRLHEGERVLTASQARKADRAPGSLVISGNNFHIREEADIDRIATKLYRQYQRAAMLGG